MRKQLMILLALLITSQAKIFGQETGQQAPAGGPMETFSEWKKVEQSLKGGTVATYEYRIALAKRQGVGCWYNVEVKNTSAMKLKIRIDFSYVTKLMPSGVSESPDSKIKPGETSTFKLQVQGCKKDKGSNKDDYGNCMACPFDYKIMVAE